MAKKTAPVTAKRNPTDATLRNVRAASKRIAGLELLMAQVMERVRVLEERGRTRTPSPYDLSRARR